MHYGIMVRVIPGFKYKWSVNGMVYVYDGLYKIVEAQFDVGKSGFVVFKFKLVRMENQVEMGSAVLKFANTLRTRLLEARPIGYVSFDISMKKENVLVFLFNDIDNNNEPMYYEYLAMTVFPQFVYHLREKGASAPNAPSKKPSTKDTSSSSIDYIPKSPTSSSSLSSNGYLNPPTSPPLSVSPPPPTQENASMDITLTLSPTTSLDVQFDTASPSPPIFGHPIP
nr:histone-lysine N-methyltransferase family member SUVH9-like [Tanacetum cinerariifolium]